MQAGEAAVAGAQDGRADAVVGRQGEWSDAVEWECREMGICMSRRVRTGQGLKRSVTIVRERGCFA